MLASLDYVFTGISIRTCTLMYEICSCHYGYFNIEGVTILCCNKFVGVFKSLWKIWFFFWRRFLRNFLDVFRFSGILVFSGLFWDVIRNIRIFVYSKVCYSNYRVESSRVESSRIFDCFEYSHTPNIDTIDVLLVQSYENEKKINV